MKITTRIDGVDLVKRSLALLEPNCRRECIAAVDESSAQSVVEAKSRVPRHSGELASTIRRAKSDDGLVAWLEVGYGSMLRRLKGENHKSQIAYWLRRYQPQQTPDLPGIYAMVVEFGDAKRNHPAHPFITPAIEAVRPAHLQRIAAAIDRAVQSTERAS